MEGLPPHGQVISHFLNGVRLHQVRHEGGSSAARWASEATALVVAQVAPQPDDCILDLAAGRGEPGLSLAAAGARVTLCDIDPDALRAAEDAAARIGVRVQCRAASAEALPFADGEFEVVTCQWGLSHLRDPGKAIYEAARVLRSGGRAVVLDWGRPEGNPLFNATFALLGGKPAELHPWVETFSGAFEATSAAFHQIRVCWGGRARALLESILANTPALAAALDGLAEREIVLERAASVLEAFHSTNGIELPSEVVVVNAARPRRS